MRNNPHQTLKTCWDKGAITDNPILTFLSIKVNLGSKACFWINNHFVLLLTTTLACLRGQFDSKLIPLKHLALTNRYRYEGIVCFGCWLICYFYM